MTNYDQPSSCLSPETLALMAAGKLTAAERATAEAHLATCSDCYDVLMELAEVRDVSLADAATARDVSFADAATARDVSLADAATARDVSLAEAPQARRRKPIIVWGRSIIVWGSIAAVLVMGAFVAPRFLGGPDRELNSAVGTLAEAVGTNRPSMGRLNGGFAWGTAPAITRGAGTTELPLAVQDAVLAVKKLAAAGKTARAMDALGVAHLVAGDLDASLAALDEAVALDPKDAAARADLAAARFEKWRRTQAPVDATAALDAAQYALLIAPKDPVARFNHALAVEALGLNQAAIESWKAYVALDATSKWADEARAHLAKLGSGSAGGLPADTGRDRYLPDLAAAAAASSRDPRRLDCVNRGRQAIADSRAAFDASHTAESERLAQVAKTAFVCGRVPTFEADAQIVWTHYFLGTAVESPALAELAANARQHGYLRAAGRVQYARGRLADNAARYSDAEEFFGDALDAFTEAGDLELIASTNVQMAEITNAFGDAPRSWDRLSTPLRALTALSPRRQHMALTGAHLAADHFGLDGAAQFFADALVAADERNSKDAVLISGAYLQSARAALRLGDTNGAVARLAKTRAARDAITDRALRVQYDAEISELEGRVFVTADPPRAIRALTAAMSTFGGAGRPLRRANLLLIRGRAYRAAGDAAAAEKDWVEGAGIFEDQRPEIRDAQQQIDHFDQLWDLFRELMTIRADDGVAALEVAERFRGRALLDALSRDKQLAPLSGERMYRWLPAGVTAVEYAVLPDQLLRWTISRDRVVLDPVKITAADLTALVDRYRAAIASRGDTAGADATRLAQVLLPASLDSRACKRLVFLPDGPIFGVPFAALPLPGAPSRLVVDDFVTSVAPSLTVLKNGPKRARSSNALLIAAADANAGESLPALPGAAAEIQAVASVYPNRTELSGSAATPAAILRALPSAAVMHFAGHAVADGASPSRSRLLVAGPAMITFDDLRRARLSAGAVVVLSACDAARGRVFHGEGAVGLAYPFLANGALAVVASIWKVDDATPASLWQSFHARLGKGVAPDAALAESQRMIRSQGVPPSVWAAFESVGGLAGQ